MPAGGVPFGGGGGGAFDLLVPLFSPSSASALVPRPCCGTN